MPKSRGRKPKKKSKSTIRRAPGRSWIRDDMEQYGPWVQAMLMADEAEARGDALAALDVMEGRLCGPDGELFWRPWRIRHLIQLYVQRTLLPSWVTSRWVLNQAVSCLNRETRERSKQALELVVDLRGGEAALPGRDRADAFGRIADRDWVYRQLMLYDLGGLAHFVKNSASPDLVARADSIHEWAGAVMGGYRLIGSDPSTVTWLDLASNEERHVLNIGSAALVMPGEHVIGRLVPIEGGSMFESCPLSVTAQVAEQVAADPPGWLGILRAAGAGARGSEIVTTGQVAELVTDVPEVVWQTALLGDRREPPISGDDFDEHAFARLVIDAAEEELDRCSTRRDGEVDIWPCLGAALLDPSFLPGILEAGREPDLVILDELAELLPAPAGTLCGSFVVAVRGVA